MSSTSVARVVDCTLFSSTFPPTVPNEISRDAHLNLLDEFFSAGIQVVVLEGKPDVGKTRLAAQFALRHAHKAISIFIRPKSWFTRDTSLLLTDVAQQMHWALYKRELTPDREIDETFVRKMSFELQRAAKKSGELYYIIIDGIGESPDQVAQLAPSLLSILPFEYVGFRFLLSGTTDWIPAQVLSKIQRKDHTVTGFSLEESVAFFTGFDLSRDDIEEIHRSCRRGAPGYLASVRRLVEKGTPTSVLLEELPKRLPMPFELEWANVDKSDSILISALSILAHDSQPHSVSDLRAILSCDSELLRGKLESCSFVDLPVSSDDAVNFTSTSFRRFASEELKNARDSTWELLIHHLSRDRESDHSIELLPGLFEKAGRPQELIQLLNPTTLVRLAEQSESLGSLYLRSDTGLKTALKLGKQAEALRFGILSSTIVGAAAADVAVSEVRARMAVEDYDSAITLAQSAPLRHQRLQLLAAVARHQRVKGLTPEPALLDVIEALVSQRLSSPSDKIFLLREWCKKARETDKAAAVIDYAVHLAIRTTEYSPTATDLRDLASPLPGIKDANLLRPLLTAFDIQKEAARKIGPTQDYIGLQLLLAQAEATFNPPRANERLLEVYFDVRDLKELDTRTVCTALLISSLTQLGESDLQTEDKQLKSQTELDFNVDLDQLLGSTADHYAVTRRSIEALAKAAPIFALKVTAKLNTELRRDTATFDVIQEHIDQPVKKLQPNALMQVLGTFGDPDQEDELVADVLERFARVKKTENLEHIRTAAIAYCERARRIRNPVKACRALVSGLTAITGLNHPVTDEMQTLLEKNWKSIDDSGERLSCGYKIVIAAADQCRELARNYLKLADEIKVGFTNLSDDTYMCCLRLAVRTYSGLLVSHQESIADVERLLANIEKVPSRLSAVYLWTDLALRCFRADRTEDAKRIVTQRIKPTIERLRDDSQHEWIRACVMAAPAVYETNRVTAPDFLCAIPFEWRDSALEYVIRFRMTGVPSSDPHLAGATSNYHIDYDTCLEILKLLESADSDVMIYRWIRSVSSSASWKHNRSPINQNQKNELSAKILELAAKKLPSLRHIKHEGFKVLAEAQAYRLLREKMVDWEPLCVRARALPNVADQVFVLVSLTQCFHGGSASEKVNLLREAKAQASHIASKADRAERLLLIAETAQEIDKALARQILNESVGLLRGGQDGDIRVAARDLVDLAYEIDPELAATLASRFDDDPARNLVRKQIEINRYQAELRKPTGSAKPGGEMDPEEVGRAAWDLLGQLNSGRVQAREVSDTLDFIVQASSYPMEYAFPILSFVIENTLVRRAHAEEARRLVRDMFEGVMASCETAAAVLCRTAGRTASVAARSSLRDENRFIVTAGQREKAIDYLRTWLSRHAEEQLIICDPYFGPADLEVLQLILSVRASLSVTVLTSVKAQKDKKVEYPWEEYYVTYWKKHFSDQSPPPTEIVIVGGCDGQLPVHDRWWLSSHHGLRLGTSFNGLGVSRDSEISQLTPEEVRDREDISRQYITRSKREHMGEKLTYTFFEL